MPLNNPIRQYAFPHGTTAILFDDIADVVRYYNDGEKSRVSGEQANRASARLAQVSSYDYTALGKMIVAAAQELQHEMEPEEIK